MKAPRSKQVTVELLRVTRDIQAQAGDDLMILDGEVIGVCTERTVFRTKQPPQTTADNRTLPPPTKRSHKRKPSAKPAKPGSMRSKVREAMLKHPTPLTTGQIIEAMGASDKPDTEKAVIRNALHNLRGAGWVEKFDAGPGLPATYALTDKAPTGDSA